MIRLVCLLKRDAALAPEAFFAGLRDVVGPAVAGSQAKLGLIRYVQLHADPDAAEGDRIATELRGSLKSPFEAMADFWWPSHDALEALLGSSGGASALALVRQAGEGIVDAANSQCWLAHEFPQVSSAPGRVVARPRTPLLKLVFPLMPRSGMSDAEAQSYWLTEHGPLVRSYAVARGTTCYYQVHRRDYPLAAQIASALGFGAGRFIGHAEAWFDRSRVPLGADVDQARLTAAQDERNFIELGQSFLFSGKEYPFVEREWAL